MRLRVAAEDLAAATRDVSSMPVDHGAGLTLSWVALPLFASEVLK